MNNFQSSAVGPVYRAIPCFQVTFYRELDTDRAYTGGADLGLMISKLWKPTAGKLACNPSFGSGTTSTFTLPLAAESNDVAG